MNNLQDKLPQQQLENALEIIKQFCQKREFTAAAAESVSTGMLQNILGSAKGARLFFEGGITAYNCSQKSEHLNIDFEECNPYKGVTQPIAEKMALGACKLFNCELGLSLTGFATPDPDHDDDELFAYGAVILNTRIIYSKKMFSNKENADEVKADFCYQLIGACGEILQNEPEKSML